MHQAALHIPLIVWFPERLPAGEDPPTRFPGGYLPERPETGGLRRSHTPGKSRVRTCSPRRAGREILAEFWDETRGRFSRAFFSGDLKLVVHCLRAKGTVRLEERSPGTVRPGRPSAPIWRRRWPSRLEDELRSLPQKKSGQDARKKKEMEKLLKSLGYL